jgi:hypothetical protein
MRKPDEIELRPPRLRGFPEGLLDQPFYGWGATSKKNLSPLQRASLESHQK